MKKKIEALNYLGAELLQNNHAALNKAKIRSYQENSWFTEASVDFCIQTIATEFLNQDKLEAFVHELNIEDATSPKKIGIIPAGNIPMVGFHDILCTFLTGHISMIKFSQKDEHLTKAILDILFEKYPEYKSSFLYVDKLAGFDAVIATGSNNTSRYFDYYFKDYPSIIRKNRSSISILSGNETDEELTKLGDDVFLYYGLGCRNVSKVYVPNEFEITRLFELWTNYDEYKNHHKFRNNFEYNNANFLLNQEEFLTNDVFILKESKPVVSRISVVHYERYSSIEALLESNLPDPETLQCVSTNLELEDLPTISFGQTQIPHLSDFADGVNTISFLNTLS